MNALRSTLFASSAVLLVVVGAQTACTTSSAGGDCGPSSCGACQDGFVSHDRCEDGEWACGDCVPAAKETDVNTPDGSAVAAGGCGPSPCGACQDGFVADDSCAQGRWSCGDCHPIPDGGAGADGG